MPPPPSASRVRGRGRPRTFDRNAALERAMHVFWEKGFAGASMSDLKAAMGIASPSLYAAFGSKEGLYREAIDRYVALHSGSIDEALRLPTARESIERLLRNAVASFSRCDVPSGCMVMQTAAEAGDMSPELAASLCDLRAMNEAMLVSRLRKGVEDGDVDAGTDIEAVADFYATVHKGLSLSARGGADRAKLDSVVHLGHGGLAVPDGRLSWERTPAPGREAHVRLPPRVPLTTPGERLGEPILISALALCRYELGS